jgi:tRNA-modifying protein YgfZ
MRGRPDDGYRAATEAVAVLDRSGRARLSLRGRAPEQVLAGLVSGSVPGALAAEGTSTSRGRAEGSALLTPKGRMVAELRILRAGPSADDGFLLDLPAACRDAALDHIRKYVPPRLATIEDVSEGSAMITVLGPRAAELLAAAFGVPLDGRELAAMQEGDLLRISGSPAGAALTLLRTGEVAVHAFDVLGEADAIHSLASRLESAGASSAGPEAWETLRIEAGRPEYGVDMDDATLPVEAGIHTRVVDYRKGCFTGQEVLIRIRDRGHVNRMLRGLRLGDASPPAPGTELFRPGEERAVGRVTSAARSPRFDEVIGLGYVRREVSPPAELRLGDPAGPPVRIRELAAGLWAPEDSDGSGAPAPRSG